MLRASRPPPVEYHPQNLRLVRAVAALSEQLRKLETRVQMLERPRIAHVRERTTLPGPNDASK